MVLISAWKVLIAAVILCLQVTTGMDERSRLVEYHKRNYHWPLAEYVPNTTGWRRLMEERFAQVSELDDLGARYDGYMQTMSAALTVPNFTEFGFGLAKCPDELLEALQQGIRDGLPKARSEGHIDVILGPNDPLFIDRRDLTNRVLYELHGFAEKWAGIYLQEAQAYGFRLYQNQSQLLMHVDRTQTHVISFILHIDSSDDAEPWPIFIEDFHGNTHEVELTPGDMLFYESAKCFHGRPKPFNGSWYTSVFVHYFPEEGWSKVNHQNENHYAVPPSWNAPVPQQRTADRLQMFGTSMMEPDCLYGWCRTKEAVRWGGPAEHHVLMKPNMEREAFFPDEEEDEL